MAIEAVIFDVDGTIVDTREFIFQSYEHVARVNNFPLPSRAVIASRIGHRLTENMAFLFPGVAPQKLLDDHRDFQMNNIALVGVHPEAAGVIEQLRAQHKLVALWTSRRRNLNDVLRSAGYEPELFDAIVDGDMVQQGKPNPEGLLVVLDQLRVLPEHSIMVGDANVDIEAAKQIGVAAAIGLTHGFGTRAELQAANADYIIDSCTDLLNIIDTIEHT